MNLKHYHNTGRTLPWGKDISPDDMNSMKNGEIFTLLTSDGRPYSEVLMDSYDVIRERLL